MLPYHIDLPCFLSVLVGHPLMVLRVPVRSPLECPVWACLMFHH